MKRAADKLACVCGHPVSHHRTAPTNQYNAGLSRCAYKAFPTDAECPCQRHRDDARASARATERTT